ncbi:hypothetical protein BS78_01G515200 [Paspalum vaginatum]|nr:hypothetical protein BS78_01G515200 [Paspalum vaginatum]
MPLGVGASSWDASAQPPGLSQEQDNTFLHWIIGGGDASSEMPAVMDHHRMPSPRVLQDHQPPPVEVDDTKPPAPFGVLLPEYPVVHHPHHPMIIVPKAESSPATDDTASAVDQLAEAAKRAQAGDVLGAREILARLNHRLPGSGTPLLRSAFYFKEALRVALSRGTGDATAPVDVLLKLGAYKAFSEVSPVLQFAHFTCVQAVLDQLGPGAGCIHMLDFDIGVGDQWASLMQELAQRRPAGAALKVTALVSSHHQHHPLELQLVHENLSSFAAETRVPFQFACFNLDAMADTTELLAIIAGGDAIAVHLPVGSVHGPAVPSVLHLVRRLGAKLVVCVDDRTGGGGGGDLPFAEHLFRAFKSCAFLLESLDAAVGTPGSDMAGKIERFLIQPTIERCVVRRYRAAAASAPWQTMLASAGFVPVQASSFSEAQVGSLLKKVPVRGFRVEKSDASLALHWQRGELISVSAWRC